MTGRRVFGIVAVILSFVVGLAGLAFVAHEMQADDTWKSPGTTTVQLGTGKWLIQQQVDFSADASNNSKSSVNRTVTVEDLSIEGPVGPDSKPIAIECIYCDSQELVLPLNYSFYVGVGSINVPTAGEYTITSKGPTANLAISDPMGTLERAGRVFGVALWVAFMLFVMGVLLIVFGRRRGQASPLPPRNPPSAMTATTVDSAGPNSGNAMAGAPSGWYPDPYGPDYERWWDGKKWTDHRR